MNKIFKKNGLSPQYILNTLKDIWVTLYLKYLGLRLGSLVLDLVAIITVLPSSKGGLKEDSQSIILQFYLVFVPKL